MTPYEIMLSESQERMLLVVKRGREAEVEAIFEKWDLHAANIGIVTDDGLMRVKDRGDGRRRDSRTRRWSTRRPSTTVRRSGPAISTTCSSCDLAQLRQPPTAVDALLALLASPTIASKRWVYRQYDHMVRTNTLVLAGMGAGVVRVKGTSPRAGDVGRRQRPLRLSRSAARRACSRLPRRRGTSRARARVPIGAHQLPELRQPAAARRSCGSWSSRSKGIARGVPGARHADYRRQRQPLQRDRRQGHLPDAGDRRRRADRGCGRTRSARAFQRAGDAIVLLGESFGELGGSEYLKTVHDLVRGVPPALDLAARTRVA